MKKRKMITTIGLATIAMTMSACGSNYLEIKKEDVTFKKADAMTDIAIEDYTIPLPEHASLGSYCYYDGSIYYSVVFDGYLEELSAENGSNAFESTMNTQIHSYSCSTGEDRLLYTYDIDSVAEPQDFMCDGEKLYW